MKLDYTLSRKQSSVDIIRSEPPQPSSPLRSPRVACGKATLLRLLTNAVYSGRVEHKGVLYAGEHPPIIETALWESINARLRGGRRPGQRVITVPQAALLKGVLYCGSCNLPMMPTYTSKGERRFRYYVCRTAKNKGAKCCPTKSVAARVIEDSISEQIRSALSAQKAREELHVSDTEWQAFAQNSSSEFIRSLVRRVTYDGVAGAVSLELGR